MMINCRNGFWALWDNIITIAMAVLLRETYYVYVLQRRTPRYKIIFEIASYHIL
jgi:hypothetical protein